VKREIYTMKHNTNYLKKVLTNLLTTDVLNTLNRGNPFSERKEYARTNHVRIYRKGVKYACIRDVFSLEDVVSGVIFDNGELFVCFEESREKGIILYSLNFHDQDGDWRCNLWYSDVNPTDKVSQTYASREAMLKECSDYFILLRRRGAMERTMICRSWRIRDDNGEIRLPLPQKHILLMNDT
jgi:hypothetical protein